MWIWFDGVYCDPKTTLWHNDCIVIAKQNDDLHEALNSFSHLGKRWFLVQTVLEDPFQNLVWLHLREVIPARDVLNSIGGVP